MGIEVLRQKSKELDLLRKTLAKLQNWDPSLKGGGKHINTAGGGALGSRPLFGDRNASCALMPGFEEADKFKPSTSRTPALHLQFYSSVSVWRGTEGGGVDAHRKRHLNQDYLTPSNKGEGAYGCCLDLMTCSAKH